MEGMPILVTGGEQVAGLAVVRGLRAAGWRPYVVVVERKTPAAWSRAAAGRVRVPHPDTDPAAFVDALASAATRLGAVAVLPGTESTLVAVAEHADRFPAQVALGAPPTEVVSLAIDKRHLEDLARAAGLRTPPTRVSTGDDWREIAAEIATPAVIKPARSVLETPHGRVWVGVQRANSPDELRECLTRLPAGPALVQPLLPGRMVTVNGACWKGSLVCSVHQTADRLWPLDMGVLAYARTIPRDADLDHRVARFLESVGWSGLFNLQFIAHGGDLHLIDLNPRPYHSLALAIAAGQNLPAIWVELLLGRNPQIPPYRVGARFRAEEEDAQAMLTLLSRRDLQAVRRALRPHRRTAHALLARGDPLPAIVAFARAVAQRGGKNGIYRS
jgi:predicted ATP-grasp superfamily ATP-dependent carboligase